MSFRTIVTAHRVRVLVSVRRGEASVCALVRKRAFEMKVRVRIRGEHVKAGEQR